MNRFLVVCFLFFLTSIFNVVWGQISGLDSLYNLGEIGKLSGNSTIQAPSRYVKLTATYLENRIIIEAKILDDWHLYSVTQPAGGTCRTEISFQDEAIQKLLTSITPIPPPHVETDVPGFNVPIETHEGSVIWVCTFRDKLSTDAPIRGNLNAQFCQSGEGGTCIAPADYSFEATLASSENDIQNFDLLTRKSEKISPSFTWIADAEKPISSDVSHDSSSGVSRGGSSDVSHDGKIPVTFEPQEMTEVSSISMALFYAFLGGIILNFMPCVLPVIGLKIMSFFEQAGKSRGKAFYLNCWYSLGLMSVFVLLAFLSLGLSILFTFDLFNIIMACIVFVMALSLMDIWELAAPNFLGTGKTASLARQEGAVGTFFKGIITTLLAIPCGAPLLSPALNWADIQIRAGNTPLVFVVYCMIGLGMASPYLILGAFPELLRFLPKPGQWMDTFKKTMGFCLLIAVIWILYFVELSRLLPTVALLFALWFACFWIGRLDYSTTFSKRIYAWFVATFIVLIVGLASFSIPGVPNSYTLENAMQKRLNKINRSVYRGDNVNNEKHWTPFSLELFEGLLYFSHKPVVVDFTADWCVNCKVLEATVLETAPVLEMLEKKHVVSLVADCTREGEAKKFMRQLGADQVPVLALFDPKNPEKPIILRGFYTQKTLLDLLEKINVLE
ncbi:MAG: cytochrome c biogenesis protein CcdA [Thermoguttaceae bacterium]